MKVKIENKLHLSADAISLMLFGIFIKKGLNHENIHAKQQKEMFYILFYIFYLIEYAVKIVLYLNMNKAYRNISFERESYTNEKDLNYTEKRKFCKWIKYLMYV